ncbi:uncharacterized protein LOC130773364 [Actinidia eriantha]|uniref:uncharacterized protein LOC130773364 n=1 Tax=Actinidia eriantha TaxID=165200 RepID=UPI00258824AA|nr:uncharacterized protein LOC130773364 [Actinidia eriantha]
MDGWRRQRGDSYDQEVIRTKSQNRKPPTGSNWQSSVPSWEKKFCTVIGSIPWRKVLENKKFIHLYDNVLKWNDSAGEEAFQNAKNRFWAEINGLPCDISLPDPDIYIDQIDWNSKVDPELVWDLECESVLQVDQEDGEQVVIFGEPLVSSQLFSPTGWGDAEEDLNKNIDSSLENKGNSWEEHNPSGRNKWEKNNYESDNFKDRRNAWEPWGANNRSGETAGRYMSRYKTSRFHGDDYCKRNPEWRAKGRKRVDFVCEKPFTDKSPASRQWNSMNTCGPVSHHGSAKPGDQWSWEKPVS